MATKKRKTKKSSKRGKGLRGLGNSGIGKKVGLLLTNVLAANLAHEGIELLNSADFMQLAAATPAADGTVPAPSKVNIKQVAASGGAALLSAGLAVWTKNDWVNALATGVSVGSSIHVKELAVKPLMGLGAVDDFLDLYRTERPLKDLSGMGNVRRNVPLAGPKDEVMMKFA
jgi:hypothetical protein